MFTGLKPWLRPDVIVATACVNVLALALPMAVLHVYDRVLKNQSLSTLVFLSIIVLAALAVEIGLRIARASLVGELAARFEHRMSLRVFSGVFQNSRDREADSAATLERFKDIAAVKEFCFGSSMLAMLDLPFSFIALVLIINIAGPLTLAPVAMALLLLGLVALFARQATDQLNTQQTLDQRRFRFVHEVLTGLHTMRSLSFEQSLLPRHERLQAASAACVERIALISGGTQAVISSIAASTTAIVVVLGATMAINGDLTIGALAATSMLAGRMMQPIVRTASSWSRFFVMRRSLADLQASLADQAEMLSSAANANGRLEVKCEGCEGHLQFYNASIPRRTGGEAALKNIHFAAFANSITGLVGAPGTGKSLLLQALAGEIEVMSGVFTVDGVKMTRDHLAAYRERVALVTSEGSLFTGTILENVAMFREGEHIKQALSALHQVGLDDFIAQLPDGVATKIHGGSSSFPPGVTQRLLLARALATQPRVLLLDVANQGLDFESDQHVLALIKKLSQDMTIVLISERPSYVRLCDAVYRTKDGRLELLEPNDLQSYPHSGAAA